MVPETIVAIACCTAVLIFNVIGAADNQDEPTSEQLVLNRLVGTWEEVIVSKPAQWNPREKRTTGEVTREWVLEKQFVQELSRSSGRPTRQLMWSYDRKDKVVRHWLFDAEGTTQEATGQWDERSKTLTMPTDLGKGITQIERVRFVDDDHYVWTSIAKNEQGAVLLDIEGSATRIGSQLAEVDMQVAFTVIEIQQTGGFAGVVISYRITSDGKFTCTSRRRGTAEGKLDAKEAKALSTAVAAIDWGKLPAELRTPTLPTTLITTCNSLSARRRIALSPTVPRPVKMPN